MSAKAVDNSTKAMGFSALVSQCEPFRVTYAPAQRHAKFGHFARPSRRFEGFARGLTSGDAGLKVNR